MPSRRAPVVEWMATPTILKTGTEEHVAEGGGWNPARSNQGEHTWAPSETALAEANDEQQALADAAKEARATGATEAVLANHVAQAASTSPDANHKARQQVAQLAAGAVERLPGARSKRQQKQPG